MIPPGFNSLRSQQVQHADEWIQDPISHELLLLNRFDESTDQVKEILFQDAIESGLVDQSIVKMMSQWRNQLEELVSSQYKTVELYQSMNEQNRKSL